MSIMRKAVVEGAKVRLWGKAYGMDEGIWSCFVILGMCDVLEIVVLVSFRYEDEE